MATRDEVKPNLLQRIYRTAAGYALPGSAVSATAGIATAAAGVIAGAPVLAVAGLGASAVSAGVFVGSAILGNEAHKEYRQSIRSMVQGSFEESERAASRADNLGAVNGKDYLARSLAWRAAVGAVVLSSVSVQAAAGSAQDTDVTNAISAGTQNAIYQQMDNSSNGLDNNRSLILASNFADTGDYSVEFLDPEVWNLETGIPKMTPANREWVNNLRDTVDGMQYRMEMGSNEADLYPLADDFFSDSYAYIEDTWNYSTSDLFGKTDEFKNMNWEDKVAILDKVIDKAGNESRVIPDHSNGTHIGKNMQMLVWLTETRDGMENIAYPSEGFFGTDASLIPNDIRDSLDRSLPGAGNNVGINPREEGESGAEQAMQQILLNLAVNQSDDVTRHFIWDKYRAYMGDDTSGLDLRDVPPSSIAIDAEGWMNEAYEQMSEISSWTLDQGYESEEDIRGIREVLAELGSDYSRMGTESKLAVVDQLLSEGRQQVVDNWPPEGVKNPATNVILALAAGNVGGYNSTPEDVKKYRAAVRFGDIEPLDLGWQHAQFSKAVHRLALTENDPIVRDFLWDQLRDVSGMDESIRFQMHMDDSRHGSLESESQGSGGIIQKTSTANVPAPRPTDVESTESSYDVIDMKKMSMDDLIPAWEEQWISATYVLLYNDPNSFELNDNTKDALRKSLVNVSGEYNRLSSVSKLAVLSATIDQVQRDIKGKSVDDYIAGDISSIEKLNKVFLNMKGKPAIIEEYEARHENSYLALADNIDKMTHMEQMLYGDTYGILLRENDPIVMDGLWSEVDVQISRMVSGPGHEIDADAYRKRLGVAIHAGLDKAHFASAGHGKIDLSGLSEQETRDLNTNWGFLTYRKPNRHGIENTENLLLGGSDSKGILQEMNLDRRNRGSAIGEDELKQNHPEIHDRIQQDYDRTGKLDLGRSASNDLLRDSEVLQKLRDNRANASEYLTAARKVIRGETQNESSIRLENRNKVDSIRVVNSVAGSEALAFRVLPKENIQSKPSEFDRLSGSRDKNHASERFVQSGIGLKATKAATPEKQDIIAVAAPVRNKQGTGRA